MMVFIRATDSPYNLANSDLVKEIPFVFSPKKRLSTEYSWLVKDSISFNGYTLPFSSISQWPISHIFICPYMHLKTQIETSLKEFLGDLGVSDDMAEVAILKAKIECLRLAAETLAKLKQGTDTPATEYKLPDFKPKG